MLRRAGWPAAPLSGDTLRTDAGPLRLVVTVADTDGGASTRVSLWGEALMDRVAVPVERGAVWRLVKAAARRVGADVRYARP